MLSGHVIEPLAPPSITPPSLSHGSRNNTPSPSLSPAAVPQASPAGPFALTVRCTVHDAEVRYARIRNTSDNFPHTHTPHHTDSHIRTHSRLSTHCRSQLMLHCRDCSAVLCHTCLDAHEGHSLVSATKFYAARFPAAAVAATHQRAADLIAALSERKATLCRLQAGARRVQRQTVRAIGEGFSLLRSALEEVRFHHTHSHAPHEHTRTQYTHSHIYHTLTSQRERELTRAASEHCAQYDQRMSDRVALVTARLDQLQAVRDAAKPPEVTLF